MGSLLAGHVREPIEQPAAQSLQGPAKLVLAGQEQGQSGGEGGQNDGESRGHEDEGLLWGSERNGELALSRPERNTGSRAIA
jgi:hypothetical protein